MGAISRPAAVRKGHLTATHPSMEENTNQSPSGTQSRVLGHHHGWKTTEKLLFWDISRYWAVVKGCWGSVGKRAGNRQDTFGLCKAIPKFFHQNPLSTSCCQSGFDFHNPLVSYFGTQTSICRVVWEKGNTFSDKDVFQACSSFLSGQKFPMLFIFLQSFYFTSALHIS